MTEVDIPNPVTQPPTVSERVCAAKAEIGAVPKNGYNSHGDYKFASTDDVYHAVRPVLAKHGLDLRLDITDMRIEMRPSRNGETAWAFVQAEIGFDGETPQRRHLVLPMTGPQTYETINSYLQKQFLRARLQIPTGEYEEHDMAREAPSAPEPEPAVEWEFTNGSRKLECSGDPDTDTAKRALFARLRAALGPPRPADPTHWTPDEAKTAREIAEENRALIGSLPDAGRQILEGLWAAIPSDDALEEMYKVE